MGTAGERRGNRGVAVEWYLLGWGKESIPTTQAAVELETDDPTELSQVGASIQSSFKVQTCRQHKHSSSDRKETQSWLRGS